MDLSIIIPVYNVAPYLRACLDSVCVAVGEMEKVDGEKRWTKEGRFLAEVICVDDGSTDGSGKILDEYVERVNSSSCEFEREGGVGEGNGKTSAVHLHLFSPPSFRVIHQKNAGVSAARNAALDIATGEWVMMLDGDDTWAPDLLARLFSRLTNYPDCELACFRCVCIDGKGGVVSRHPENCGEQYLSGDDVLLESRGRYSSFIWGSCDKIIRRDFLDKEGVRFVPGMRRMEDTLFAHKLLACADRVALLPEIEGYFYLMREGSAVHIKDTTLPHRPFILFEEMYALWRRRKGFGLLRRLQLIAAEAPALASGPDYDPGVRNLAIEYLLRDPIFNQQILPFMFWHGTRKSRLFAGVYKLLPRYMRRKVLLRLGRK